MAFSKMVKPETAELLHLTVLRTERLAPHWVRVTLGGGEIDRFRPMGYDQWFRLFLPIGGEAGLERVPAKANRMFGYLKFLRIPDGERPVMRNYTVRAYRPATPETGAELDVDFVLHGSAADGTAGPASRWAETCAPGEHVLIIDEGLTFNPERGTDRVVLGSDYPFDIGLDDPVAKIRAAGLSDAVTAQILGHNGAALLGVDVETVWDIRNRGAVPPGALPRVRAFVEEQS